VGTLVLPYLPFAPSIGLTPLSPVQLGALLAVVLAYTLTAELLKWWFFKKYKAG
jgi:hypothetical protein